MQLAAFNHAPDDEAREVVSVWARIPAWAAAVVAERPYADVASLASAAERLAETWTPAELDAALAHHPRIGQRAAGSGAEAAASSREQASMASASERTATDIAEANAAYEHRFGRVFLIRAAGRTPEEMLAEARRRVHNDDATETAEAIDQLRQIAMLRLRTTIEE